MAILHQPSQFHEHQWICTKGTTVYYNKRNKWNFPLKSEGTSLTVPHL